MLDEANKRAEQAFRETTDIDNEQRKKFTFLNVLGGDILNGKWFRNNVGYILLVVFLTIIYVSARYGYEAAILEQNKLDKDLLDRNYKVITVQSKIKELDRIGRVKENLSDTTLKFSGSEIYEIQPEQDDTEE